MVSKSHPISYDTEKFTKRCNFFLNLATKKVSLIFFTSLNSKQHTSKYEVQLLSLIPKTKHFLLNLKNSPYKDTYNISDGT